MHKIQGNYLNIMLLQITIYFINKIVHFHSSVIGEFLEDETPV